MGVESGPAKPDSVIVELPSLELPDREEFECHGGVFGRPRLVQAVEMRSTGKAGPLGFVVPGRRKH